MNLFELAHHPEAFKNNKATDERVGWWGSRNITSDEQYNMLNAEDDLPNYVGCHTDENEFRMHLLFVHWATS